MKLRKVLFVLIVAMLAFDFVLIARHKRSPLTPPLASGASQDSAESKLPEYNGDPVLLDPNVTVSGGNIAALGPGHQFIRFTVPSGYLDCPVAPVITFPLHCETADGKKMKLVLVPDDAKAKPAPMPPIEWEPPAPKPAGERKL